MFVPGTLTVPRLLAKRSHFIPVLLILLAFPAVALAAGDGGTAPPPPRVAPAKVAPLAELKRPVINFRRLVKTMSHEIRVELRAEERRRERELFASLPGGVSIETLESIASCESGGNPAAVSSDGTYRGKYQFDFGTWESVGGHGDPAAAPEAEQDYRAALLYTRSGSSPWPVCG